MNAQDAQLYARRIIKIHGQFFTTFIATDRDGAQHWIACPWGDEREKNLILDSVHLYFFANRIVRYMLLSEVWMSKRVGRPSEDPDREEALAVLDIGGENPVQLLYPITRAGNLITISEEAKTTTNVSGRMTELLPPSDISDHLIIKAQEILALLGPLDFAEKIDFKDLADKKATWH